MLVPLLVVLAATPAVPDAGSAAPEPGSPAAAPAATVGPATPARGSSPEKLPFTPDTIKDTVRAKQPDIERCWEQTLAGTEKPVDGKLQTHCVITPVGSVKQAKVVKKGTTLKDPALHRCVETVLSTMLFPRPPDGKDHPVEYPFNLKAVR
ncbi:MAG TPA: AgmX/PglI C-terminal domain-containing protein [Myxococcaceae bacterium]|nr:AgmX/PglI C-terminal domain-containing protein [Myxococcaceae bacterium]